MDFSTWERPPHTFRWNGLLEEGSQPDITSGIPKARLPKSLFPELSVLEHAANASKNGVEIFTAGFEASDLGSSLAHSGILKNLFDSLEQNWILRSEY